MKHNKKIISFLHFIILSYNLFKSFQTNSKLYSYSPDYFIENITNIFLQNYSSSISINAKEILFSNKTNLPSDYSHFLVTSKYGNISIISENKSMFTFDFKKKMHETNIEQTSIINEDKVVLAFEGKLFIVNNNLEVQNFEEFTTPISELVEMTPFSLWFMPEYYFMSTKNYSIIKIINNNSIKYNFDIDINLIVFIDYTLICLKDKEQVWNATITNAYFLGKNDENNIKNKKIEIDELMLIYENNEILEKNIKNIVGSKYNDILSIHGYDKVKKKYVKIYDFNTFNHIVQNNTINNIEEKSNIINGSEYVEKYEQNHYNFIYIGSMIILIILCIISLIFYDYISKIIYYIFGKQLHLSKNPIENNIIINKKEDINIPNKNGVDEMKFQKIKNIFMDNNNSKINDNSNDLIERKKTIDFDASKKSLEIIGIIPENDNKNILKSMRKNLNIIKSKKSFSDKNIKRFKEIKKSLNISSFSNSNTELNEVPQKNNEKNQYNSEKKYDKDILNIKKEMSSPSSSLTRLEKDFKDITLIKKSNIGIILKARHKIDEEIYAIKIMKLSNPNDEQSVISEAKNMTKIHTKHIIEYITCWFDKSLGKYEYFFGDENDNESFSQSIENEEKNFSSSKTNKKVYKEDNNFTHQISQDQAKEDHYIKQLYEKSSFSDNEYFVNKKKLFNLENKFYQKKNNEENKFKYTNRNNCLDDSLLESKISQKNIPNLNMYFFIQMEYCQGLNLSEYINNNIKNGINNKIIYLFAYQIIKSLAKIHENKIVHRGINPENIFVINESQIKIGGFSSAKEIKSTIHIKKVNKNKKMIYSQSTGNLGDLTNNLQENDFDKENFGHSLYLSPEQEQGYQVTKKSDIYSAGLIIYTMCECLEKSKRQKSIMDLKKKKIVSEEFKKLYDIQYKLILKMIEDDPENRPNCDILLNSEEMKKWKNSLDDN